MRDERFGDGSEVRVAVDEGGAEGLGGGGDDGVDHREAAAGLFAQFPSGLGEIGGDGDDLQAIGVDLPELPDGPSATIPLQDARQLKERECAGREAGIAPLHDGLNLVRARLE